MNNKNPDYPFRLNYQEIHDLFRSSHPNFLDSVEKYDQIIKDFAHSVVEFNKAMKKVVEMKMIITKTQLAASDAFSFNDSFILVDTSSGSEWIFCFSSKVKAFTIKTNFEKSSTYNHDFKLSFEQIGPHPIKISTPPAYLYGSQMIAHFMKSNIDDIQSVYSKEIKNYFDFVLKVVPIIEFVSNHRNDIYEAIKIDSLQIIKTDITSTPQEILQHMVKNSTLVDTLNLLYDFDLISLTKNIKNSIIQDTVKKKRIWFKEGKILC